MILRRCNNLTNNIFDKLVIPLQIISHGEIRGKVRLQKLVFLSQISLQRNHDFNFEPAPLGPLSNDVNYLLSIMKEFGIIKETIKTTNSGHDVYCYNITDFGKGILSHVQNHGSLTSNDLDIISSICKNYRNMPYMELLDDIHNKYPQYHLKDVILF